MVSATWNFPTTVRIGAGRIAELGDTCRWLRVERPLVVTDPGFAELPAMEAVLAGLGSDAPIFRDVRPNPTGSNIEAGIEAYRRGGHDCVIAVGGGSALDAGKVIALMVGQTKSIWDFEDGPNWTLGDLDAIAPVIAVPTTAGTGSEVGRAGVVINEAERRKVIVFHPGMMPAAVISDPELTVGLPRALTVGTGMDALSHSLEAISAPAFHPMALGIGMEGCRLVFEHLPRVAANPDDIESRTQMMAAASMGAVAFSRGLGAMHSISHPIGALFNTHHGTTNAVVMPYVLRFNAPAISGAMDLLGAYCSIAGGTDGIIERILEMRDALGVPHTLTELGVDPNATDEIARAAVVDPTAATNPVPLTVENISETITAAHSG